jgi:hypothetical protein
MPINLDNMLPYDHASHTPNAYDKCLVCNGKLSNEATQKHRSIIDAENPNYIEIYFLGFLCGSIDCSLRAIELLSPHINNLPRCYSGTIT